MNQALIAKAAKTVLATTASEAICGVFSSKQAKHIGTTDRMARLRDETTVTARAGRAGPA